MSTMGYVEIVTRMRSAFIGVAIAIVVVISGLTVLADSSFSAQAKSNQSTEQPPATQGTPSQILPNIPTAIPLVAQLANNSGPHIVPPPGTHYGQWGIADQTYNLTTSAFLADTSWSTLSFTNNTDSTYGNNSFSNQLNVVLKFTPPGSNAATFYYWLQNVAIINSTGTRFNGQSCYGKQGGDGFFESSVYNLTNAAGSSPYSTLNATHGSWHSNYFITNSIGYVGGCPDFNVKSSDRYQMKIVSTENQVFNKTDKAGGPLGTWTLVPAVQFQYADSQTNYNFETYETANFSFAKNPVPGNDTLVVDTVCQMPICQNNLSMIEDAENVVGGTGNGATVEASPTTSMQLGLSYFNGVNLEAVPDTVNEGHDTGEESYNLNCETTYHIAFPYSSCINSPQGGYRNVYATSMLGNLNVMPVNTAMGAIWLGSGMGPKFAALDTANGSLYVTDYSMNAVSVVSTATDKVLGKIHVGIAPQGIAFDGLNGYLYVANEGSNNVTVINSANNRVVASIGVGSDPYGVAFVDWGIMPTVGEIYVTNLGSGNVSIISSSSNSVVATVQVGSGPIGVVAYAYSTSGPHGRTWYHYAYVANFGSNNVSVINGTNKVQVSIGVGTYPFVLAFNSQEDLVYVSNWYSSNVTVINVNNNHVIGNVWVGPYPLGIAYNQFDNEEIVALETGNSTRVIAGTSLASTGCYISVGYNPEGVVFDPLNGQTYVMNYKGNSVSIISGYTDTPETANEFQSDVLGVAYDSTNGYLYMTSWQSNDVTVMNGATGVVVATVLVGTHPEGIAYDSKNNWIYVANTGSNNVSVIVTNSLNTSRPGATIRLATGSHPYDIAVDSYNGKVFVTDNGTNKVTVITGTGIQANLTVGSNPAGIAYDSTSGNVYVANFGTNNVSVVNGSTGKNNKVLGNVPGGLSPLGVAYDSGNGLIYVTDMNMNCLTVISGGSTFFEVATITLANGELSPRGVVYDSANGHLYVAAQTSYSGIISVISGFSNTELENFSGVNGAQNLAYDSATENFFATQNSSVLPTFVASDLLLSGSVSVPGYTTTYLDGPSLTDTFMANTTFASGYYHTWTNYTNGWINDIGFCSITVGNTNYADGVPDACSDPPAGPAFTLPGVTNYLNLNSSEVASTTTDGQSNITGSMMIDSPTGAIEPCADTQSPICLLATVDQTN
jgi:YVTN family beta-propeller protein